MSAYSVHIALTIDVINARARSFRNQVVCAVIATLSIIVAAIALRSLWPLTGLFALVPACGAFLWLDAARVAEWRSTIVGAWERREINLLAFSHAMRANTTLPQATLNSMLYFLQDSGAGAAGDRASISTRRTAATVTRFSDKLDSRRLAVKIGAAVVVAASVLCSAGARTWTPLAWVPTILLLPMLLRWLESWNARQSSAALSNALQCPDFDAESFR